mmetsp:Transcript_7812/g.14719  ORF Transcript_7812/g.14719 Transcript_7812/m.14719 type:complete len:1375 (+) Transcript_7812:442-4566(+)
MMTKQDHKLQILVGAYANYLQQHLSVPVTPVVFFNAGYYGPVSDTPCSLITVEPFCPGGKRRLVLNAHHPLIHAVAKAFATRTRTDTNRITEDAVWKLGEAMILTASMPLAGLDVDLPMGQVRWETARGVICGPQSNWISPVPHEILHSHHHGHDGTGSGDSRSWGWTALAIWPRKQIQILVAKDKSDLSKFKEKVVVTQWDKWKKRDEILWKEWKRLHGKDERNLLGGGCQWWRSLRFKSVPAPAVDEPSMQQQVVVRSSCGMASFSPFLPILALAQFLQSSSPLSSFRTVPANSNPSVEINYLKVNKIDALKTAASILLSCDRLFCLSIFFGVPLLDRTKTLHGAIQTDIVVRNTPSREEVEQYKASCCCKTNNNGDGDSYDGGDDGNGNTNGNANGNEKEDGQEIGVHEALEAAMLKRASDLWQMAQLKQCDIVVCWSGGIDSTGALVALLRTATTACSEEVKGRKKSMPLGKKSQPRLVVTCDDESMSENPTFFSSHIRDKVKIMERKGRTISDLARENSGCLIVTGELGDQLFGSDRCRMSFPLQKLSGLTPEEEALIYIGDTSGDESNLDDPWEDGLLKELQRRGLLAGTMNQWKSWISPQLDKAPFKIKTLFDMLWWLNFSCKWQNVNLRHMHDGGELYEADGSMASNCGSVVHFYDDHQLECWACVEEFHKKKFGDWKDWKTYKEPLKFFIHCYHDDPKYYHQKEKVGSLAMTLNESQRNRVDGCIGIYKDAHGVMKQLHWSLAGSANYLEQLLDPWIFEQRNTYPPLSETVISIDPWMNGTETERPFMLAPYFAQEDERRHRLHNPITVHTLAAKCSALLPPDTVKDKTVLDLGACLGAMCHWSLFHGAKSAVAVEPQMQFCMRMMDYLKRAESTWSNSCDVDDGTPSLDAKSDDDRYKIICADARSFLSQCKDQSFDIIVIAGVLHCFQDPITIISEVARVSKEIIVIESTHTYFDRKGFNDPVTATVNLLEWSPSAKFNKAGEEVSFTGVSCVPSKQLIQNAMYALGFSVSTIKVAQHPTRNEDILTYNGVRRFEASPVRFFLRCIRTKAMPLSMKPLEDVLLSGKGVEQKWINETSYSWIAFSDCDDAQGLKIGNGNHDHHGTEKFISWEDIEKNAPDVLFNASNDEHPYKVQAWGEHSQTKNAVFDEGDSTVFGYVYKGETAVVRNGISSSPLILSSGMCFCCQDKCEISGGSGLLITVPQSFKKSRQLFTVAGPLQGDSKGDLVGSLPYIDGCTDTILIHPQVMGDPCLNHLHFPPNVKQTQHTHPSGRAGIVIKGEGRCVVIDPLTKDITKTPLRPGTAFVIPTNAPHAFETEDSTLDVIAFHPDSDYGPTNTNHPMVNRTIVDGISASLIPSIQTQID